MRLTDGQISQIKFVVPHLSHPWARSHISYHGTRARGKKISTHGVIMKAQQSSSANPILLPTILPVRELSARDFSTQVTVTVAVGVSVCVSFAAADVVAVADADSDWSVADKGKAPPASQSEHRVAGRTSVQLLRACRAST